jgi:polar amino acid transport system substrate-binding protein
LASQFLSVKGRPLRVQQRIAVAILAALSATVHAAESPVVVGVANFPPHVMESDGTPEGFDIDIWNEISKFMSVDTKFTVMPFDGLLKAIEDKEVDVAIAGISITYDRELRMDFSLPYMDTGLRILAPVDQDPALIRLVRSVSTEGVLAPISYLMGFVLLCAHVLYFAERGSPAVDDRYFPGIFEAAWCVLATITTVGYGDIAPGGWLGRFVAFLVMVIGISLFGVAIAELSSALMMEHLRGEISGPEDLSGRSVSTVAGTTSAQVARRYGARVHEVTVIEEGYSLLQSGEVDAVLFDAAPLLRHAQEDGGKTVTVVGPMIERQAYGIAFPQGSPLREPVNRALLRLNDTGGYDAIYSRWFGNPE